MNSRSFLQIGGVIFLLLGIIGFILVKPLGTRDIWFTPAENYGHMVVGFVALLLSTVESPRLHKWTVASIGVITLYAGVWGFVVKEKPAMNFYNTANFELADNIIHIIIAAWALKSAFGKGGSSQMTAPTA